MAKISALPIIATEEIDGTEDVPVVKSGATMRMKIASLIGSIALPFINTAQAWAESPTAPDPADATSKSAKTWSEVSETNASQVRQVVDIVTYERAGYLFSFVDSVLNILGGIKDDASWDVVLDKIQASNGLAVSTYETVGDPEYQIVIVDEDGNILWTPPASDGSGAEVIAARGSRASLDDRISEGLSECGLPRSVFWGAQYLSRWRSKLSRRLQGEAVKVTAATHMDSWGGNSYFARIVSYNMLPYLSLGGAAPAVGWSGPGWIGFGAPATGIPKGSVVNGLYATTRVGTWTDVFGTNIYSPDECSAYTATNGDYYRISSLSSGNPVPSSATLVAAGDATVDVSWDDGATWPGSITLSGLNREAVALPNVPATGDWQLRLRKSGGTRFEPMGVLPQTAASGAVMHMINATGTTTTASANPAAFAANAALLSPDLVFLGTPINDRNAGVSPEAWAATISSQIDLWRAYDASVSIVVVMPPEVKQASGTVRAMDLYYDAIGPLVHTKRIAVIGFRELMPGPLSMYAHDGTWPLLDSIDVHFAAPDGVPLCAATVRDLLINF